MPRVRITITSSRTHLNRSVINHNHMSNPTPPTPQRTKNPTQTEELIPDTTPLNPPFLPPETFLPFGPLPTPHHPSSPSVTTSFQVPGTKYAIASPVPVACSGCRPPAPSRKLGRSSDSEAGTTKRAPYSSSSRGGLSGARSLAVKRRRVCGIVFSLVSYVCWCFWAREGKEEVNVPGRS